MVKKGQDGQVTIAFIEKATALPPVHEVTSFATATRLLCH
jgi:hypothetical protein